MNTMNIENTWSGTLEITKPRGKTIYSILAASIPVAAAAMLSCAPMERTDPEDLQIPPTAQVREGLRDIRDTRLFVREVGPADAPVLVVVHGGPGGNHLSLGPLEQLSPEYRVVLYDQRGTGESDRLDVSPENPASMGRLALSENVEDLEALRKSLDREKITLIGHSWGATLAVFYTAAYPEHVEKLIVYSGGPEDADLANRKRAAHDAMLTDEEKGRLKEGARALGAAMQGGASQEELDRKFMALAGVIFGSLYCERPTQASAEKGRAGFWANQIAGAYVESFDYPAFLDTLSRVEAPVLLTWGRCEPSPRERLTRLLDPLPNARFVVFEKSGHNAMEEEATLFFKVLRSFLRDETLPTESYTSGADLPAQLVK